MLIEIAIGDAYGRPFEFNTPEFIKTNNQVDGYKHREGETVNGIGIYTDDTQMSLAIAEHMAVNLPVTQNRYAMHFVSAYKRDVRGGYSRRIRTAIEETNPKFPYEMLIKCKPVGATSNGSVMRTVPLGLLPDTNDIVHRCMVHTAATHGSLEALNATVAVALTAHYFYHYQPQINSGEWRKYEEWMTSKMGPAFQHVMDSYELGTELPCDAMKTASCSIKLAMWHDNMSSLLFDAIDIGGDVDSSASVAIGLASLRGATPLPDVFYKNLENGRYGRDYIKKLDEKLLSMYPRTPVIEPAPVS